jgi:hypothetical protein
MTGAAFLCDVKNILAGAGKKADKVPSEARRAGTFVRVAETGGTVLLNCGGPQSIGQISDRFTHGTRVSLLMRK